MPQKLFHILYVFQNRVAFQKIRFASKKKKNVASTNCSPDVANVQAIAHLFSHVCFQISVAFLKGKDIQNHPDLCRDVYERLTSPVPQLKFVFVSLGFVKSCPWLKKVLRALDRRRQLECLVFDHLNTVLDSGEKLELLRKLVDWVPRIQLVAVTKSVEASELDTIEKYFSMGTPEDRVKR